MTSWMRLSVVGCLVLGLADAASARAPAPGAPQGSSPRTGGGAARPVAGRQRPATPPAAPGPRWNAAPQRPGIAEGAGAKAPQGGTPEPARVDEKPLAGGLPPRSPADAAAWQAIRRMADRDGNGIIDPTERRRAEEIAKRMGQNGSVPEAAGNHGGRPNPVEQERLRKLRQRSGSPALPDAGAVSEAEGPAAGAGAAAAAAGRRGAPAATEGLPRGAERGQERSPRGAARRGSPGGGRREIASPPGPAPAAASDGPSPPGRPRGGRAEGAGQADGPPVGRRGGGRGAGPGSGRGGRAPRGR